MVASTKPMMGRGAGGDELKRKLGAWLREKRLDANLTQGQLAANMGLLYYTAISAIEVGRNVPPPERYVEMAKALNIEPREFARVVLEHTNPWLYGMLFGTNAEGAVKNLTDNLDERVVTR